MDDFFLSGPIGEWISDTGAKRIGIVAAKLVQVVGQIVHLRVPHSVFVVDQNDLRGVLERREDIVFLCVIVAHDNSTLRDTSAKHLLVPILQISLLEGGKHCQDSFVTLILGVEL